MRKLLTSLKPLLLLLIVIFSIIGLADSGYVTYKELTQTPAVCGGGFDCNSVLTSQYAHFGPVPISALGFIFYLTMLTLTSLAFLEISRPNWLPTNWQKLGWFLSVAGFIFTLYLIFLMAVVLQAWCLYCLISAFSASSIFLVQSLITWQSREETSKMSTNLD